MNRRMLFVALGVAASGAALGVVIPGMTNDADTHNPLTDIVITTHNPPCTAVFLHHLEATRLTDVKPTLYRPGYSDAEYRNGINVTAVVLTSETNRIISAVLQRPEVSGVVAYPSVPPNATAPARAEPTESRANPDVVRPSPGHPATECDVVSETLADTMLYALGWAGSPYPDAATLVNAAQATERNATTHVTANFDRDHPDSWPRFEDLRVTEDGMVYYGDRLSMLIRTNNAAETWTYLKNNGAHITYTYMAFDGGPAGSIRGFVTPSLVWSLMERGFVEQILVDDVSERRHHGYG